MFLARYPFLSIVSNGEELPTHLAQERVYDDRIAQFG